MSAKAEGKNKENVEEVVKERMKEPGTCALCGTETPLVGVDYINIYKGNGERVGRMEICSECFENFQEMKE